MHTSACDASILQRCAGFALGTFSVHSQAMAYHSIHELLNTNITVVQLCRHAKCCRALDACLFPSWCRAGLAL